MNKFIQYLVIIFTVAFLLFKCFPARAGLSEDLATFDIRIQNEIPMPIGDVCDQLQDMLLQAQYSAEEKRQIAAKYVQLKLKVHQAAPVEIIELLRQLLDESQNGRYIKLGLARMNGINADYETSYRQFAELIKAPTISPELRAFAIAYLVLTYNEGQVFAPNVKLINTLDEITRGSELPKLRALYFYMAADYHHSINSFDTAFEYYEKSLAAARQQNLWILISDNLYATGILFRNQGKYDRAISYFEQTIANDKNIDISYSEYLALYGMASTYFRTDNIERALSLAEEVTSHPLTSSFYDSEVYRLKAKALLDIGRLEEAREALNMSRQTYNDYRKDEKTTWRAELEKIAAEITAQEGDYETAYREYVRFHQDYVQAKKYEELEFAQSSNLVLQMEQQKEKAQQLEKENQAISGLLVAKEAAQQSQKFYTQLLTVLIVLTLFTLAIILVLFKKARKTNALYVLAKEKAELHSRLKTEFISNISHEIRTPLNAIIGFGQVLTDKLHEKSSKRLTSQIVNSSEMLLQLINDLLDFSKMEVGKLALDLGAYNLRHSLKKLGDIFHAQASNKGLKLVFMVDPSLPKYLIYDELRLKQVLANLMSNAIKFSERGQIEIEVKVLSKDDSQCKLIVSVKDSGIGISLKQQETLFEPFIQAESSTARKYGGSGLGLNICDNLLELMGSSLDLDSEVGQGSCFHFTLSLQIGAAPVPIEQSEKHNLTHFNKTNVLLAEDNEINVEVIQAMLTSTNLNITRAVNGKDAIEKINQQTFDIVLMDIQMPEMDGIQATRLIRQQQGSSLPIVALTANAMQQDIEACIAVGMDEHISKPIYKDKLLEVLYKFLNQ